MPNKKSDRVLDSESDKFWSESLKSLRKTAKVSCRQLAHVADVPPEAITRFENGTSGMTIARLERLLTVLGHEIDLHLVQTKEGEPVDVSWIKDL